MISIGHFHICLFETSINLHSGQHNIYLVYWPEAVPPKKWKRQEAVRQKEEHVTPVTKRHLNK